MMKRIVVLVIILINCVACSKAAQSTSFPSQAFPSAVYTEPITNEPVKEVLIRYASYPGDGGGCNADYLGTNAPLLVLFSDGQLIIQNSHEDRFWYTEYELDHGRMEDIFLQINKTGFFSVRGDGKEYEHDPIYQFPQGFKDFSEGAGTLSLEIKYPGVSKEISIYVPYLDYLVPEISHALHVIENLEPDDGTPFEADNWVAWVGTEDPCEPYLLNFKPWPDGVIDISTRLHGKEQGIFTLANSLDENYRQVLGSKPEAFIYPADGKKYFIFTRPLLPGEMPSDISE